jgi:hypothetical protein
MDNITPSHLETGVMLAMANITPMSKWARLYMFFISDELLDGDADEVAFTAEQSKSL